jgi:hypothetical protein
MIHSLEHDEPDSTFDDAEETLNGSSEITEDWEKGIPPFVRKLTKMVGENPDQIDWSNSGSFLVREIDSFSSTLLPKYFKSIKFCSFVRQLNMYNFHKVEDQPNSPNKSMEFSNPNFLPGRKDLLKRINRRKTVKRGAKDDGVDAISAALSPKVIENGSPSGRTYTLDENSYKGLLHAVLKLQQQAEITQLTLKSVVDQLNYFRKSHFELEQKVQQLTIQQNGVLASAQMFGSAPATELYSQQQPDISSLLFDDTADSRDLSNGLSASAAGRSNLLSLINDHGNVEFKFTPFDFNNFQVPSEPESPLQNARLSQTVGPTLYDATTFGPV